MQDRELERDASRRASRMLASIDDGGGAVRLRGTGAMFTCRDEPVVGKGRTVKV